MDKRTKKRIAIAGDREIALQVIRYLISEGDSPVCLLLHSNKNSSHSSAIRQLCSHIPDKHIFYGKEFKTDNAFRIMRNLDLDFLISIHFHYIFPPEILSITKTPLLNLHPAFLPFNRGWHTPSWAILDDTPYGASLHIVDSGIDTGDIIMQEQVKVLPCDTANSLYQKVLKAELDVFKTAWPALRCGNYEMKKQIGTGTQHTKKELSDSKIQCLDLKTQQSVGRTLDILRALTTNDPTEAAYFEDATGKYRVRVDITPLHDVCEKR